MFYGQKLFDPRWIEKRKKILNRDNNSCQICSNSSVKLHIHHKQYHFIKRLDRHVDPWEYDDRLLITLCESCHSKGHKKYEVPIKYI